MVGSLLGIRYGARSTGKSASGLIHTCRHSAVDDIVAQFNSDTPEQTGISDFIELYTRVELRLQRGDEASAFRLRER